MFRLRLKRKEISDLAPAGEAIERRMRSQHHLKDAILKAIQFENGDNFAEKLQIFT